MPCNVTEKLSYITGTLSRLPNLAAISRRILRGPDLAAMRQMFPYAVAVAFYRVSLRVYRRHRPGELRPIRKSSPPARHVDRLTCPHRSRASFARRLRPCGGRSLDRLRIHVSQCSRRRRRTGCHALRATRSRSRHGASPASSATRRVRRFPARPSASSTRRPARPSRRSATSRARIAPPLAPGRYRVEATLDGFETAVRRVALDAGQTRGDRRDAEPVALHRSRSS